MSVHKIDRRESILARLVVIAKTVVAPECVFRNQNDIPETARPAIVIYDADEVADSQAFGRGRPPMGTNIMIMSPEVFALLEAGAVDIGPALNTLRARFVKAVLTDATLVALVHNNDIRYTGFTTALAVGRSMEGDSGIGLEIRYLFRPEELGA